MKMLTNRSLHAVFFVILLMAFLLIGAGIANAQEYVIQLTPEEEAWLAEHPKIIIAYDDNSAMRQK